MLLLTLLLCVIPISVVHAQEGTQSFNYDLNGKRVTYYPESLMISRNPHAIVFYKNTKLLNLFVDLRAPDMGNDFTVNNTCEKDTSQFLSQLLEQLRNSQKAMHRVLSSHGYTSLIECDSYLRRYYQYSTGFTSTMSCPYSYRKSLRDCKLWALQTCQGITSKERQWLQNSKRHSRKKRSLPWACSAGVLGIPKFFYTKVLGHSCDNGNIFGLITTFMDLLGSMNTMDHMIKTVNGKTIYLAKISDKLVTKVNNLQSSLREIDSIFSNWKNKLQAFANHENCHFTNFMEFLSKFSLEVTRTFATQLRFTEINDILHQAHNLHNKQLVGFNDLPSFLATAIQHQLNAIHSLHDTATALDVGYPLLIQPLVDYKYNMAKSMGINILFTIPELSSDHSYCTLEYLMPIKYNISGTCFQGPITRDELALLRCQQLEYIIPRSILEKCYHTGETFVCSKHILQLVNDTNWLGLPWHKNTKLHFVRRHQQAPDCSNIPNMFHLGGRYYLSTQQGSLTIFNTTNGSTHIISLSPLTVYHFPCDLTFVTQQTGLGTCPDRITLHLPLFTANSFHYVPWKHDDDNVLRLHYKSLNFTPPLKFDNSTMNSLEHTFRLLDGQLTTRLASLKQDISHLHTVQSTTLNDWLTYITITITLINTFIIILLYCRIVRPIKPPTIHKRILFKRKQPNRRCQDTTENESDDTHELQQMQPSTSNNQSPMCTACNKPVPV